MHTRKEGGLRRLATGCRWPYLAARILSAAMLAFGRLFAQEGLSLTGVTTLTNGEVQMKLVAAPGFKYRIETAAAPFDWTSLLTFAGTGTNLVTDSGALHLPARFYRAVEVADPATLTGDHLATAAGDIVIHPVNHASFVMQWQDRLIYNDPVGGATPYKELPRADLVLVSHSHSDHFDSATLNAIRHTGTLIIAPAMVYSGLSAALKALTIPLANGEQTNVLGLTVEAVPAYNGNHPKGLGNAYVLTVGGRRLFMSGDTGNTAEMRSLRDIDVAFVCMNVPFTMTVTEAVTAVRSFQPKVVYPYHFRNQNGALADVNAFKRQVGADLGIEVRLRKWY